MTYIDFEQLPLVLSPLELSQVLGLGMNSTYDLIRSEKIRSVRCGHQHRIPKSALIEFLNATSTEESP